MSKVTLITYSVASAQALVTLENGDRHGFNLEDGGKDQIVEDATNGELELYLSLFDSDTPEEMSESEGKATDWVEVFRAA